MTLMLKGLLNCVESVGLEPKIEFFRNTKNALKLTFSAFEFRFLICEFFYQGKWGNLVSTGGE